MPSFTISRRTFRSEINGRRARSSGQIVSRDYSAGLFCREFQHVEAVQNSTLMKIP